MKTNLVNSAVEGFVGSFKLAALLVMALAGVISGFVNGSDATQDFQKSNIHR